MKTPPHCPHCQSPEPPVDGLCLTCVAREASSAWLAALDAPNMMAADFAVPQINGYDVLDLLGSGGMSDVFRARRLSDGVEVAIKIISPAMATDPEVAVRFEQEAALMQGLQHPNIAAILGLGEADDGRAYYVSEYADGCDLRRLMQGQQLALSQALDIFAKVAAGIAYAHSQGVIHRDVKPANILVRRDGSVKLTDFGLAKDTQQPASAALTRPRSTFGSAYYMAPEVTQGLGTADARADVYALGVLLYEMATGALPLGNYTPASTRNPAAAGLDHAIAAALADDPGKRTPSVPQLAAAVATAAEKAKRRAALRLWSVRTAGFLSLLGVGLAFGAAWMKKRQPSSAPIQHPPASTATLAAPWANSLGMTFVPLPDHRLLFCTHETRVRDFAAYKEAEGDTTPSWRLSPVEPREQLESLKTQVPELFGAQQARMMTWDKPGFVQTPDHPACGIDLISARLFCAWLTWRERDQGRLTRTETYRLPSEAEWQAAAASDTTEWKAGDPESLANFAGVELTLLPQDSETPWPPGSPHFSRRDAHPYTSPVGAFGRNALGLSDLYGNVSEWIDTPLVTQRERGGQRLQYGLRGGSWGSGNSRQIKGLIQASPFRAQANFGFRLVLDLDSKTEVRPLDALQPVSEK